MYISGWTCHVSRRKKKNWKKKSPQPLTDNKLLTVLSKTENLPVSCGCLELSHHLLMLSENIYSNLACTRKTPCPERQGCCFTSLALTRFSWGEPASHPRCFSNRASKFARRMGRLPVPNMKVLFDKCSQILSTWSPTHLKVCYCQLLPFEAACFVFIVHEITHGPSTVPDVHSTVLSGKNMNSWLFVVNIFVNLRVCVCVFTHILISTYANNLIFRQFLSCTAYFSNEDLPQPVSHERQKEKRYFQERKQKWYKRETEKRYLKQHSTCFKGTAGTRLHWFVSTNKQIINYQVKFGK